MVVYKGPAAWGLPDVSPFVAKIVLWLTLKGLPYETAGGHPNRAPKGKIPWVEHDGRTVSDSGDILDHLIAHFGGLPRDAAVPHDRGVGHLIRRTSEEHLYFVALWQRWAPLEHVPALAQAFGPIFPAAVRSWVAPIVVRRAIRGAVMTGARAQGIGRHSADEVARRGVEDVRALAEVLGDAPFFAGEAVGTVDCSAFGMLSAFVWPSFDSPVRDAILAEPRLVAWLDRVAALAPTVIRPRP